MSIERETVPPSAAPARTGALPVTVQRMAAGRYLAVWDQPPEGGTGASSALAVLLDGVASRAPYIALTVPTTTGQARVAMALRAPRSAGAVARFTASERDGHRHVEGVASKLDPEDLCACFDVGLDARARTRLLRWLLCACATTLRLGAEPGFVAACRRLLERTASRPEPLGDVVTLGDDLALTITASPSDLGPVEALAVVGPGGVAASRLACPPGKEQHLVLERSLLRAGSLVVLFGERGVAVRRVDQDVRRAPSVASWLAGLGDDGPRFVTRVAPALAAVRGRPEAASALWEMQLRAPWPRRQAIATGGPIAADVELALGNGAGGLFVAGWVDDPHDLVARWSAHSVLGTETPLGRLLHVQARVSGREVPAQARAFVAYVPDAGDRLPGLQHRVEVRLRSGTRVGLVAPLPPASFAQARQAVLTCVPPSALTRESLEQAVGPAALQLHARHLRRSRGEQIEVIGAPRARPDLSVVVTLDNERDDPRTVLAVLGTDPSYRDAELVFVLDGPLQAPAAAATLRELLRLHGLAATLITVADRFGAAAARNAGARVARGAVLVFLDGRALPAHAGWPVTLRAALRSRRRLGAVGPALVSDDGGLDQLGVYFEPGPDGRWCAHHASRGLPRGFDAPLRRHEVPALSPQGLTVRRSLFDAAGGFCEEYLCDAFAAIDLCLAIRSLGHRVEVLPEVTLHRVDTSVDHDRAGKAAAEVDTWHLVQRHHDGIATCMAKLARAGDPAARALLAGGETAGRRA